MQNSFLLVCLHLLSISLSTTIYCIRSPPWFSRVKHFPYFHLPGTALQPATEPQAIKTTVCSSFLDDKCLNQKQLGGHMGLIRLTSWSLLSKVTSGTQYSASFLIHSKSVCLGNCASSITKSPTFLQPDLANSSIETPSSGDFRLSNWQLKITRIDQLAPWVDEPQPEGKMACLFLFVLSGIEARRVAEADIWVWVEFSFPSDSCWPYEWTHIPSCKTVHCSFWQIILAHFLTLCSLITFSLYCLTVLPVHSVERLYI